VRTTSVISSGHCSSTASKSAGLKYTA